MKKILIGVLLQLFFLNLHAQVEERSRSEQQLENNTASAADVETEDDSYLQAWQHFLKHPVDLNSVSETTLAELGILTPLQIQQFMIYRRMAGKFIDVHELQAVPGWDLHTIRLIKPYVTVGVQNSLATSMKSWLRNGEHRILLRASQVLERSKGYQSPTAAGSNFYAGSPQKVMLRYTYAYKNSLQFGLLAEKDAGEQFFRGKQKWGFDFYSVHFFIRNKGLVRSLAIGDFTVNMGQGLVQWQRLAFRKSAETISIKRESEILQPYHSAGEINFHRGAGVTLGNRYWQATVFVSYRRTDANFVADTLPGNGVYVSSLQTSGYHRTAGEAADKGIQRQLTWGAAVSVQLGKLHLGVNGIQYRFSIPLLKQAEPYNRYALSGKGLTNFSVDYNFSFRNIHFFGEVASTSSVDMAVLSGLAASVSSTVDMSLLYRSIARSYQSLYSSAFTENAAPSNERGFYAGVQIRPAAYLLLNAYVDVFRFPWLKYRVDAASEGTDQLLQLTYRPGKRLEIYSRYRSESKAVNVNPEGLPLPVVQKQPLKSWRTQLNYQLNKDIVLRGRAEMCWFDKRGPVPEEGFLLHLDILYKPLLKNYSGNLRLQYFETGGYSSRLYAYENDVLYSYSVPVLYGKGYRYYVNLNYEMGKKLTFWFRWAQTVYRDKSLIGSGLDEIQATHKTEVKLQALYKF